MPTGYHHLIRNQRSQIYALKSNGLEQKAIAAHLGVLMAVEIRLNMALIG